MDPYKDLGVHRKASREEIKRAYREKARKLHPDTGGNGDDDFSRIALAWRVLGDDDMRDHFDATGEIFDPNSRNPRTVAMGEICKIFNTVIRQTSDPANIKYMPIIEKITNAINQEIENCEKRVSEFDHFIESLQDVQGRIEVVDPEIPNVLRSTLETQITEIERQRRSFKRDLDIWTNAKELIKAFRFVRAAKPGSSVSYTFIQRPGSVFSDVFNSSTTS